MVTDNEIKQRFARIMEEFNASPAGQQHARLLASVIEHPDDYQPWGAVELGDPRGLSADCSCGCRWYVELTEPAGADWGVCTSPKSHRRGLLTFEHQGCLHFELEDDDDDNH